MYGDCLDVEATEPLANGDGPERADCREVVGFRQYGGETRNK